jgi:hypothetical protein
MTRMEKAYGRTVDGKLITDRFVESELRDAERLIDEMLARIDRGDTGSGLDQTRPAQRESQQRDSGRAL